MRSNPSLFPLEKLLERAHVLPLAPLAGPGSASFVPPFVKHSTSSQGLACTDVRARVSGEHSTAALLAFDGAGVAATGRITLAIVKRINWRV